MVSVAPHKNAASYKNIEKPRLRRVFLFLWRLLDEVRTYYSTQDLVTNGAGDVNDVNNLNLV